MASYYYDKYTTKRGILYTNLRVEEVPTESLMINSGFSLFRNYELDESLGIVLTDAVYIKDLNVGELAYKYASGVADAVSLDAMTPAVPYADKSPFSSYIYRKIIVSDRDTNALVKNTFQETIIAAEETYPINAAQGDFWYVRKGVANSAPTITITTPRTITVHRGESFAIEGFMHDVDVGDYTYLNYTLAGGIQNSTSGKRTDDPQTTNFSEILKYDGDKLLNDRNRPQTPSLVGDGVTEHIIEVWATDTSMPSNASAKQVIKLILVSNRAPLITIDSMKSTVAGIAIKGTAVDHDKDAFELTYKMNTSASVKVEVGSTGAFNFTIPMGSMANGTHELTFKAIDNLGGIAERKYSIVKAGEVLPISESVMRYRIKPPANKASGVVLWLERDIGDLVVNAEISMTDEASDEVYSPMVKNSTAFITAEREEDEYEFTAPVECSKIIIKITMKRSSTDSAKAIRLVSGVLS